MGCKSISQTSSKIRIFAQNDFLPLPFIFEKTKYFVLLNIFVPTLSYSTQLIRFTVVNEDLF